MTNNNMTKNNLTKHKMKKVQRAAKARQHNYKENREMFIGLLR